MTGGKVILTYKRKKPSSWIAYKRRRLSSRNDFCQENEFPRTYDAPSTAEKKDESTESNESECPKKDYEHAPEEESSSVAIRRESYLPSAEKASSAESKNNNLCDIMKLAAESLAILVRSAGINVSQKASEVQLCPDSHELQKAISIRGSSCSFLKSHAASDEKSTVTCSIPLPASCSTIVDPNDSSLKANYTNECTLTHASEKFCSKETGLSVENKTSSSCTNAAVETKLSTPLITFHRRCKRKKDVNGLQMPHIVDRNCVGSLGSASFVSSQEGTHSERNSEHALIASRNVESSCAAAKSSPKSGSFKPADHKMENTSREETSTVEVHAQITEVNVCSLDKKVGLDFQEGPSGNLSNEATVDPALEPVNHGSSIGKESQILSNGGLNTKRGTNEIPCGRGSIKSLDLSVPPAGDRDIASSHNEKLPCTSLYTPSGHHTTSLNDESLGIKGLELLHENIGETHSSHQLQVLESGCLSGEAVGHKHHELTNSSPAVTMGNSYLQLFPEERMDDMSHSTKMHQKDTAGAGSEVRTVNHSENSSQDRTADAKTSLFLGLFLPMELIKSRHNQSSASSQWLNRGIQSREFLQDTVPKGFPDQPPTSLRHKMMLDNIVNRARTPKRNRSSCLNLYGYPTVWSEEELDCLWIGVRRYGRGNWEVMLRDPRLGFSSWRTPWDLAQQWEVEQSKLFNTMTFSQGRHFRKPNLFQGSMDGYWQTKIGKQHSVEDVQLSLGDVYSKPRESVQKMSLANFMDMQANAPRPHLQTVTSMRTPPPYSHKGSQRRAMFLDNATQDVHCSVGANYSTNMAMGRNRPHWLKELVAVPLMRPQVALPSDLSAAGRVEMHSANNRSISNKNEIPGGGGELQMGAAAAQDSILPSTKDHDKTKQEQQPAKEGDLIVIDSDASSEETISDDRSAKV